MPQVLMIVGAILALAGIGSIIAGAPDWVLGLSLGATLIQSGAIGLVGGLVLIALGLVLSTLQRLLARLDAPSAGVRRPVAAAEPEHRAAAALNVPESFPQPQMPPPLHEPDMDETAAWPHEEMPEPLRRRRDARPPPANEQPSRPRREQASFGADGRLRTRRDAPANSSGEEVARPRRERTAEEIARLRGEYRRREEAARSPREAPPPPPQQPTEDRRRARPPDDRGRPPDEEESESYVPRFRPLDPRPPARNPASETVVRSGVIGGMAYTLYADGSIEAELAIGTVRFNSIAELQEHVTRTGTDTEADFKESSN